MSHYIRHNDKFKRGFSTKVRRLDQRIKKYMDQLQITMQGLAKRLHQLNEQYIQQKLTIEKLEQENKQLHHIIKVQKEKHLLLKDRAEL